jgi:hypothetical protein
MIILFKLIFPEKRKGTFLVVQLNWALNMA